jgi:predicted transcriptional regulator
MESVDEACDLSEKMAIYDMVKTEGWHDEREIARTLNMDRSKVSRIMKWVHAVCGETL